MLKKADLRLKDKEWFYSKKVKEHFFNPKNFVKGSKEAKRLDKEADGVGMVGSPACGDVMKMWIKVKDDKIKECKWATYGSLLPGTKILMNDFNSKAVENIRIGDIIIDGNGKDNFVEEVLVKNYKGKIIIIRLSTSKFYNFVLTPNHPVPCVKRRKVALVQRFSGNRWSEVSQEKIDGSQIIVAPASELEEGDFLLFQVPLKVKDYPELDEDICTLLGYYVSDGSIPSKNRVIFYFGLYEKEYINEIIEIAKRRDWNYITYKRNTENVICVQINEPKIVEILRRYGGLPSKKKFFYDVILLPPYKQEKIINSYINGDGWITQQNINWKPTYGISTSKEDIAYQLQLMLGRLGIFAPFYRRESREFIRRGKRYRNSGEINLIFRKDVRYSRIRYNKKEAYFLIPISKIEIDSYNGKIYDISIAYEPKTYRVNGISLHNCASAIASTSMLSVMVTEKSGMKINDALNIKPQNIMRRLNGLPAIKYHCSVLGDKALREAINDYFRKTKQYDRIIGKKERIIDKNLKITEHDIEEAVKNGAKTFEELQEKIKICVADKSCIEEAKQLFKFYKEKYYGKD